MISFLVKRGTKNSILRLGAGILLCALLLCLLTPAVQAQEEGEAAARLYNPPFEVAAQAAYMVNEDSGVVVYEKNADQPLVQASLVKMMTCLVAMDHVTDLDGETVTADTWIFNELYGKNASHADIWNGETLTVRELLYAMIMPSANEAALMLADYVADGHMPNFLYMMNGKAKTLGCTGTYFADPNGLSEENVTTARDMYLITRAFMQNPVLREIAATNSYEMAAHNHPAPYLIATTNRLLVPTDAYYRKYASIAGAVKGGKTGSLGEWQNFASMAELNGATYYCVVLNSPNEADTIAAENPDARTFRPALVETGELYTWAFYNLSIRPALDIEKPIHEIQVKYSTQTNVLKLFPASDMRTVLPNEVEDNMIEKDFDCPEFLGAPIRKGDVVGSVTLVIDGQRLGAVDLLAAEDVERDDTLYAIEKTKEFIFGPSFKWVLLGLLLAVVLFFIVKAQINKYRRSKRLARQKQVEEELARKELEASRRVYRGPMEPPDETDVKR